MKSSFRFLAMLLMPALLSITGGCSNYTQSQMQLVEQARKGVAMVAQSEDNHEQAAEQLYTARRQRLDDAFDADVREQAPVLKPDWVIEHRKAYTVGVDLPARQRTASLESVDAARANLRAIDEALEKLYWLQSIELKWASFLPATDKLADGGEQ